MDVCQGVDLAGQGTFNRLMQLRAGGHDRLSLAQGATCRGNGRHASKVKASPITLSDGSAWDYEGRLATVYYEIYRPTADWGIVATSLQDLYVTVSASGHAAGPQARLSAAQLRQLSADEQYLNNASEAYAAIQRADSVLPTSTDVYQNLGISEDGRSRGSGAAWCSTWSSARPGRRCTPTPTMTRGLSRTPPGGELPALSGHADLGRAGSGT